MKKLIWVLIGFLVVGLILASFSQDLLISKTKVDDGLEVLTYQSSTKSTHGDNEITIIRIDPELYQFNLLSAKSPGEKTRTAKTWAKDHNQIAIVNAGMYRSDHKTNVGFMKNYDFVNNGQLNADNTTLAFNPKNDSLPPIQIIDRTCQNFDVLKSQYHSMTQSIRMVDCNQSNRWSQQPKKWSMVVFGMDKDGKALLIFTRSPHSVHDFINTLLRLDIKLYNLMYLEGGPEASIYLNHNGTVVEKMGSYETGFNENDNNDEYWNIPNVIGISKK